MQMMLSLDKTYSTNTEKIWKKKIFFGDQESDFTITKPNFPENTLVYCNQGVILVLKAGNYAVYVNYVIIAQIIPASNCLLDLDNYILKENEVSIYIPLYNTENGHFRGIKKYLEFIMVRGDSDEVFYSYG